MAAFSHLKPTLDKKSVERIEEILEKEFMSREDNDYQEVVCDDVRRNKRFKIQNLPCKRNKLKCLKRNLCSWALSMTLPRVAGEPSNGIAPDGPEWPVRKHTVNWDTEDRYLLFNIVLWTYC